MPRGAALASLSGLMTSRSPDQSRASIAAEAGPTSRTMPPPELFDRPAPDSAGQIVLETVSPGAPISRYAGPRAEEAYWRGQLEERRALDDVAGEREACVALARLLAARGTDLEAATSLAERALEIEDDPVLRTELAGWLAGLGDPALAAYTLSKLCDPARPQEGTRVLVKTAVLLARANDPAGAADALRQASELDPSQPMASELLGTLAAWAPTEVSPAKAAAAYLEAAERRDAAGEKEAAFEDRLRAFEIAPHDERATTALATALVARGRTGSADEVLRLHAAAVAEDEPTRAGKLHLQRMLSALLESDGASAVGAMLDAGLEADIESEIAGDVDEALSRSGLYALLAARLELRAERQSGEARSETLQMLAELFAGPLASQERAVEAWIEALTSDPASSAAAEALREHAATTGDFSPLVEAFIRIGESIDAGQGSRQHGIQARVAALKELIAIADRELSDAALSSWAQQKIAAAGRRKDVPDEASRGRATRTQSIMMRAVDPGQDDAFAASEALDRATSVEERVEALRRLARIYQGRPHTRALYLDVLADLARTSPSDRESIVALERLTSRTGELDPIEGVMRARLSASLPAREIARTRRWLATIARRRGDEARALEELSPLLDEAPEDTSAASTVLIGATRAGDMRLRAGALVRLAPSLPEATRAVVLAVAAELYALGGEEAVARELAVAACDADASCARAASTLAAVMGHIGDHASAAALERAISVVVPRGPLCEGLAHVLEAVGELSLALTWTQRWVALRPGCTRAIVDLVRRAAALRDSLRLGEALGWVLAQPKPLGEIEEHLGQALDVLFELDLPRATAIARRVLDVLGPRLPGVRARLMDLADRAPDPALAISVLERWLAVQVVEGAADEERRDVEILFDLAYRRMAARDIDGAARELIRAAMRGGDPARVIKHVEEVESAAHDRMARQSSDRLVSLAEARARALLMSEPQVGPAASDAWRRVGSLLWDLASDYRGADAAFFIASELAPAAGRATYARDLCEFAGPERALAMLRARADALSDEGDGPACARLLIEAANLAHAHGMPREALSAAWDAIQINPSRAETIALVERSAHIDGGIEVLDRAYDLLAEAALGCYGRRAAHYRAARQLERRGADRRALRHAIACFEAVPGTGTSYALLARVADRAGETVEAVRALQRVAEKAHPDVRADWLKRAAGLAGSNEEGARTRLDILLSALNARPDPAAVELVGSAIRVLSSFTGETDLAAMRFERAVKATLPRLAGPDGARAAIAMARVAFGALRAMHMGVAALVRAMEVDGDVEEYATLTELMVPLAGDRELAESLLSSITAAAEQPYSSVGPALLRLASKLAVLLGDEPVSASLIVHAVRRDPENEELINEAHTLVQDTGDPMSHRMLDEAVPVRRRLDALLHLADKLERGGAGEDAIGVLERALVVGALRGDERNRVVLRLRHLLSMSGRTADIEALLRTELPREDLVLPVRLRLARELSSILTHRGDHRGALEVVVAAARDAPLDALLVDDIRRLARRIAERDRQIQVLRDLVSRISDDSAREAVRWELAQILVQVGKEDAAAGEAPAEPAPEDQPDIGESAVDAGPVVASAGESAVDEERDREAATGEGLVDEATAGGNAVDEVWGDDDAASEGLVGEAMAGENVVGESLIVEAPASESLLGQDKVGESKVNEAPADDGAAGEGLVGETTADESEIDEAWDDDGAPGESLVSEAKAGESVTSEAASGEVTTEEEPAGDGAARPDALEETEQEANERADHEVVAELLLRRIAKAAPDERRALRLRRAAVLEQRLGQLSNACAELEALLAEAPDDRSALRFLADIQERLGLSLRAGANLRKLGELATTADEKAEYGLRAASSYLSGGDVAAAKEILDAVGPIAQREAALAVRVELARQEGDFRGLVQALDQLATTSLEPAERRAEILLDAAGAAAAAGEEAMALDFARRAAKLAPLLPAAVLEARRLEYRARRAGTPREAQATIDDLARVSDRLAPEQVELHAFLLAEALDVLQGEGAGMRELSRRHHEIGAAPLIGLGMAERLARSKSWKAAIPLFESALAGDLHGTRSRGRVALAGADAAVSAGELESAARLLGVAAAEADTKALAMRRQLELTAARGDPMVARTALEQLARQSGGIDRARALAQLGRLVADPAEAARIYAEAVPLAASDRALISQLTHDLARAQSRISAPSESRSSQPNSTESGESSEAPSSRGSQRLTLPLSSAPTPASVSPESGAEPESPQASEEIAFFLELVGGSFEAGERLMELYRDQADERSHEILAVRKHQASIRPGDRPALTSLHEAALADKNDAYAQAVEHVLYGFEPGVAPLHAPSLAEQREAPEVVAPLVFSTGASPLHEALAMVWETGLYRRDLTQSGLSGVPRVQPGSGVLGEIYGRTARALGLARIGLFHQRAPGSPLAQIALLTPPAVVLTGDVQRDTPDLAFLVGAYLAGATPEHALVNGLPESSLRSLISALLAAFGPLERASRSDPSIVRLGQNLWQLIPPRSARRVHEICEHPERITYEAAVEGTRRAMRRAGLFASGDLPVAVRMTVAELALPLEVPLAAPGGLALACSTYPALADLVRLATSSEYAEARWQRPVASQDRRRVDTSYGPRSRAGT